MSGEMAPSFPPGLEHEDRGPALRAFIIAMMALQFAAVVLRFWSRLLRNPDSRTATSIKLWWDDWAVLAAMICVLATGALAIDMIRLGLGKHIWVVPPQNLVPALTRLFAIYFCYDLMLLLAKTSCLLFYARVFGRPNVMGWFKWALWTTHALNISWFIGIVFGTVFMCDPIAKNYNPMLPGHCGTANSLWKGSAIPSVIIDLILLILPLPIIWKLHLRMSRKIAILAIFIFGYLVVVVSIGRLVTIIKSEAAMDRDLTYEGVPGIYWQAAEGPVTVISVCLPGMLNLSRRFVTSALDPLASMISSKISLLRSSGSQSRSLGSGTRTYADLETGSKVSDENDRVMLQPTGKGFGHRAKIQTGDSQAAFSEHLDADGALIRVQEDVYVLGDEGAKTSRR